MDDLLLPTQCISLYGALYGRPSSSYIVHITLWSIITTTFFFLHSAYHTVEHFQDDFLLPTQCISLSGALYGRPSSSYIVHTTLWSIIWTTFFFLHSAYHTVEHYMDDLLLPTQCISHSGAVYGRPSSSYIVHITLRSSIWTTFFFLHSAYPTLEHYMDDLLLPTQCISHSGALYGRPSSSYIVHIPLWSIIWTTFFFLHSAYHTVEHYMDDLLLPTQCISLYGALYGRPSSSYIVHITLWSIIRTTFFFLHSAYHTVEQYMDDLLLPTQCISLYGALYGRPSSSYIVHITLWSIIRTTFFFLHSAYHTLEHYMDDLLLPTQCISLYGAL